MSVISCPVKSQRGLKRKKKIWLIRTEARYIPAKFPVDRPNNKVAVQNCQCRGERKKKEETRVKITPSLTTGEGEAEDVAVLR